MKLPEVFKNKKFLLLWISQLLSQITLNLVIFISLLNIFESTSSAIAVSFVWVAYAFPAILIGPFASASVDIFDKRKLLMFSNFAQAIVLFLFAIFMHKSAYLVYWVVFFYQFFNQFYLPSESASLPELVKEKDYPQANSIFFLTQQAAVVVGFGGGGLLNEYFGTNIIFFLTSILLLIAFGSASLLPSMRIKKDIQKSMERGVGRFFTKIIDGYDFIKSHKIVIAPFIFLMTLQISLIVLSTVLPSIATDIVHIPYNYSGIIIVVPIGIGAAMGTLLVTKILKRKIRKIRVIEASLMLVSVCILFTALVIPGIESTLRIFIAMVVFTLVGTSYVGILIPSQTFLQEITPGGYRGRVFGNFWLLTTIATVIPVIFSATIAEIFGISTLLLLVFTGSTIGFMLIRFKTRISMI